jgi:hypothetical protein
MAAKMLKFLVGGGHDIRALKQLTPGHRCKHYLRRKGTAHPCGLAMFVLLHGGEFFP